MSSNPVEDLKIFSFPIRSCINYVRQRDDSRVILNWWKPSKRCWPEHSFESSKSMASCNWPIRSMTRLTTIQWKYNTRLTLEMSAIEVVLKGQYHGDFAHICTPLKSQQSHLKKRKPKNNGPFHVQTPYQFSETINECLWPWMARMELDYSSKTFCECFQVLCLYLVKNRWKFIMVCFPCDSSLDGFLFVFQEYFLCERRHINHNFSKVLSKHEQNDCGTATLISATNKDLHLFIDSFWFSSLW